MLSNKQIIAIDDTPSIRTFLQISLEAQGAEVYVACNASEGVALCRTMHPDIVVLDLGLPDRDGLEILPEIRQLQQDSAIIVLTVRKEREVREMAKELGATAYITKPFLMEELLEVITEQAVQ